MLNKELLMAVGESLEPVLSVYIAPGTPTTATVTVVLSSGNLMYLTVRNTERKTLKFSEIDVTYSIEISYAKHTVKITTKNLIDSPLKPQGLGQGLMNLWIEDVTQSASIAIEV